LHMVQPMPLPLTVSCFTKIQIGFTFLVLAHPGSPGQRAIKRVCVCVCVLAMKSSVQPPQFQLYRQPVPFSRCGDRESPVADSPTGPRLDEVDRRRSLQCRSCGYISDCGSCLASSSVMTVSVCLCADVQSACTDELFTSVHSLLMTLYDRDCRRSFMPARHWLIRFVSAIEVILRLGCLLALIFKTSRMSFAKS